MASVPTHVTPLHFVQPASVDLARARQFLADEPRAWLGTPVEAARPGFHRFLTDLSLPLRDHSPSLVFKKAAFVDLGELRATPAGCEMEIGWQSASLAPLFPVFSGRLLLTPAELLLDGYYAPPGGELGAVLDKAFLGIAARGTARWFLDRLAGVIAPEQVPATPERMAQPG
jgi:hypothetical protein